MQMLNQAMMLKRRVVEALHPSLLDHFGLSVALRSHFDEQCGRAGMEFVATLPDEITDLEPAVQLTLFRVAQETLTNLVARGQAKHVELVIEPEKEGDSEGYLMTLGDDSSSLDAAQLRSFVGMRHRLMGAGGKLMVDGAPGQGNRIRAFVPRSSAKTK
jgi:two-component system sensor histidine kinase UhpB